MTNEQVQALFSLGGSLAVIVVGAFFGIQWVIKTVQAMGISTVKTQKTTIITSDTISMDRLSQTLEASNVILTENNVLRREEHADRQAMREALEENTRMVERSIQTLADARVEVRELAREMAKAGR